MEQVEVEITGLAITARYGTLSSGDVLRTDAEFARHLVEDCAAAKYRTAPAAPERIAPPVEPEQAPQPDPVPKEPRQPRKTKQ